MSTVQDYSHKVGSFQQGKNWQQGLKAIAEAGKQEELPRNFTQAAVYLNECWKQLPENEQQTIQGLSDDTRTSVIMLTANMVNESQQNRTSAKAVDHLLHEAISQTTEQTA